MGLSAHRAYSCVCGGAGVARVASARLLVAAPGGCTLRLFPLFLVRRGWGRSKGMDGGRARRPVPAACLAAKNRCHQYETRLPETPSLEARLAGESVRVYLSL